MTDQIHDTTKELDDVRLRLHGLSELIWRGIDHNDSEALEVGVAFKKEYNFKLAEFEKSATEITALLHKFIKHHSK